MWLLIIATVIAWWLVLGVRIYSPWKNLGCLGVSFLDIYADVYIRPNLGMFVRAGNDCYYLNRYGLRKRL